MGEEVNDTQNVENPIPEINVGEFEWYQGPSDTSEINHALRFSYDIIGVCERCDF